MKTSKSSKLIARKILTTKTDLVINRGDIWEVRFDPSEGDEIQKIRPAVVMNITAAGRIQLHIVVPVTGWRSTFANYFWMVNIVSSPENGLSKESAADTFQVKSISVNRFQSKLGILLPEKIEEIAASIALCIGFTTK
jgi:mRNA interferase MazF